MSTAEKKKTNKLKAKHLDHKFKNLKLENNNTKYLESIKKLNTVCKKYKKTLDEVDMRLKTQEVNMVDMRELELENTNLKSKIDDFAKSVHFCHCGVLSPDKKKLDVGRYSRRNYQCSLGQG